VFPQNYDIDYIRTYTTKPTEPTTADTIAPSVNIVAPTTGATVSGTVNVTATATDNIGVAKVEFYVDGALKATKSASPYTQPIDVSTMSPGNHTLMAKAYDTSNLTAQSQVGVTVPTTGTPGTAITAPTIKITNPVNGATLVNGKNSITVDAVDTYQITKVTYYLDGNQIANTNYTPFTYYWQTRKVKNGSHILKAVLTDSLGRTATDQITIIK
jgi:hypothetical protein